MEKPDHRVVLDKKDSNPDRQDLNLNDSIDALLGEIEVSRASIEESKKGRPAPTGSVAKSGDAGEREAQAPTKDPVDESVDELVDEQVDETTDSGADAMEALEAVSQNAESLLEDTIGELLDDADADADADEPEVVDADAMITDEALLDEVAAEVAEMEAIVPDAETLEQEMDVESIAETNVDEVEGLLESINDELLEDAFDEVAKGAGDETIGETESGDELIDEVVEEASEKATEEATDKVSEEVSEEATDESVVETSDELVGDIAQEPEPETESDPESTTEPEGGANGEALDASSEAGSADDSLGDLDAALAEMSDDILMGDFETPDGDLVDSSALEAQLDPSTLLDGLGGDDESIEKAGSQSSSSSATTHGATQQAGAVRSESTDAGRAGHVSKEQIKLNPDDAVFATAAGEANGSTQSRKVASQPVGPVVPDAVRMDSTNALGGVPGVSTAGMEVESIWQTALRVVKERCVELFELIRVKGAPLAARGVLAMSKPVASKPAQVRDSIGYVAIWTLLLATILWMYAMFFRASPTPVPSQAPTRVVTPGEDLAPIEHSMSSQRP